MAPRIFVLDDRTGLLNASDLETITLNDVTPRERNVEWGLMYEITTMRLLVNPKSRYLGDFHILDENTGIYIPGGFVEFHSNGIKWAKVEDPNIEVFHRHDDGEKYFGIKFEGKSTVAVYDFRHNKGGPKGEINELSITPSSFGSVDTGQKVYPKSEQRLHSNPFGVSEAEGNLAFRSMVQKVFEVYPQQKFVKY
jgi:hypothetical protein